MSINVCQSKYIVGMKVNQTSYEHTVNVVLDWAVKKQSSYICIANVHMVMEGKQSFNFQKIVNNADLVTPDGMPLVWMMRLLGERQQMRVRGPSLLPLICQEAAKKGVKVGFYGSTDEVLGELIERLLALYPTLQVAFSYSPPFRALSEVEDAQIVNDINSSGAQILFVGLGCPKQEVWMAQHREKIVMPMLGVGAAFDICSGIKSESPLWLQRVGLEWVYRFMLEPRRLWRRYLIYNPLFMWFAFKQLLNKEHI